MKKTLLLIAACLAALTLAVSCDKVEKNGEEQKEEEKQEQETKELTALELAERNMTRACTMLAASHNHYISGKACYFYYYVDQDQPSTNKYVSIWEYTSAIEATAAVMNGLNALKAAGKSDLYNKYFEQFHSVLNDLYEGMDWYEGTLSLISYCQTRNWTVYGVNRANGPGAAEVDGVMNVYDDQEWIVREMLNSYKATGEQKYFDRAEYLAEYLIDGWDCTLKSDGTEHGGIPWGPGYITKHSCSNGPFVAPLVWLSNYYKGKGETATYRYIGADKKRLTKEMDKSEYYLMYARKVYDFHNTKLYDKSNGVYYDMLGAKAGKTTDDNPKGINYEVVDGVTYRANNNEQSPSGTRYSYNTGTMLSGAADLYGATKEEQYMTDMTNLSNTSFAYFAKPIKNNETFEGYYDYVITGNNVWFNDVLLRGWADVANYTNVVAPNLESFQKALDYAYEHHLKNGTIPNSRLYGWGDNYTKPALANFADVAEFAYLAMYNLAK